MKMEIVSNSKIKNMVLILIGFTFLLSEWMIGLFTFADFLMLFISILVISRVNLKSKDFWSFVILEGYLAVHILWNVIFNEDFILRLALTNMIKIFFYHTFILLTYKFITQQEIENRLLKIINIFAVISIIIGLYISVVLIFDLPMPYEFLWTFTRTDRFSYTLRRTSSIIRTRSVFSEPAHFGYFLNIILSINLFSRKSYRMPYLYSTFLIIGIIASLSYSSIVVLMIILTLFSIKYFASNNGDLLTIKSVVILILVLFTAYILRDFLYQAVYIRTIDILTGNDGSFTNRIFSSWTYLNSENILFGNGLGHTPNIQNVYAYLLSDLGLVPFVFSIYFTYRLVKYNYGLGISFMLLNFTKGGYLSPVFSLYILLILIYINEEFKEKNSYNEVYKL